MVLTEETQKCSEDITQRHFVHHKSHMGCPGTDPRAPWWEAYSYLAKTGHGPLVLSRLLLLKGQVYHLQVSESEVSTRGKVEQSVLVAMRGVDAELPHRTWMNTKVVLLLHS